MGLLTAGLTGGALRLDTWRSINGNLGVVLLGALAGVVIDLAASVAGGGLDTLNSASWEIGTELLNGLGRDVGSEAKGEDHGVLHICGSAVYY